MVFTPKVSVVIDNYNYGRYLGEAIDGVLRQKYDGEVECIVVDDGSTDDSRSVIRSFGERVRAILQENRGQATAFNTGFEAARGDIICLLDSDDYWKPEKLAAVAAPFADKRVGIVQHFLQDVDAAGRPLPQRFPDWPESYTLEDFLDKRIHFTATSGLAFRRSELVRALPIPKDVFYYLDDMLFVKVLFRAKAVNIPKILGVHRNHGGNFCFAGYRSPRKLELDMKMNAIFHREIDPLLDLHGKEFTERYRQQEEMEYFRRRILLYRMRGEWREAAAQWSELARRYGRTRFGFFRTATCLLALLSTGLYLRFYELYSRLQGAHLRFRLFPE
ncbi:MAG: glycosyltransferase family 2 protein [Elusimicrobiota bacterium]